MILIHPKYEIDQNISGEEILRTIERCARIAYKSEDKTSTFDNTKNLISKIIESGHESVIEHYYIRVKFWIDRGISHELCRHRLVNITQESTRYCSYNKDKFGNQVTFIIPNWLQDIEPGEYTSLDLGRYSEPTSSWLITMFYLESRYMQLTKEFKWTAQQARCVLPNSLKTEIVVTANLREWRHIFKMRTALDAHPQMREVMVPLLEELKSKIPVVFDSITY